MTVRGTSLGALALALRLVGATGCLRMRGASAASVGSAPISRAQIADTPAAATPLATDTAVPGASATTAPPSGSPVPAASADAPTTTAAEAPVVLTFNGGAGGKNKIQIVNKTSGRLRVDGKVDYGHAKGPKVGPENSAIAYASCADCQTFAIALQIVLYRQGATQVTPLNQAIAVNVQCSRCLTVARAVQYVIPVEDPTNPPENVKALAKGLNDEMTGIERDQASLTVDQAEARIDAVIAQFRELGDRVVQQRDQQTEPTTGTLPAGARAARPQARAARARGRP
ncbi:MAG TPA: hypothetical protein VGL23_00615 [Chloroflexota bacterium]